MQVITPPQSDGAADNSDSISSTTETDTAQKGTRRRLSEEQQVQIAHLYAQAGASVADIRRQFGVSEPSIYRVLQKKGVALRGRAAESSDTRPVVGTNRSLRNGRRSRRRGVSVAPKGRTSRSVRTESNNSVVQFRIDFRVEHVIDAADVRDALRKTETLGATEIVEITRVA